MAKSNPLVSIGMPVYNGERHVGDALDSLLWQDYDHFELLISDNASTDATGRICGAYAARDERIRYYRSDRNLGAVRNFNKVFAISSGRYFMWAGSHDLWDPTFLRKSVNALEMTPGASMCFTLSAFIDPTGAPWALIPTSVDLESTVGLDRVGRLHVVLQRLTYCPFIYGLMRREALAQTGLARNVWASDYVTVAELSLLGSFVKISEVLLYLRLDPADKRTPREVWEPLDPRNPSRTLFLPWTSFAVALLKAIACSKIRTLPKLWALLDTLYGLEIKCGHSARREIAGVARALLGGVTHRTGKTQPHHTSPDGAPE